MKWFLVSDIWLEVCGGNFEPWIIIVAFISLSEVPIPNICFIFKENNIPGNPKVRKPLKLHKICSKMKRNQCEFLSNILRKVQWRLWIRPRHWSSKSFFKCERPFSILVIEREENLTFKIVIRPKINVINSG